MTNAYREDFPILLQDDTIYFDNAATSQRPRQVTEAMRYFFDTETPLERAIMTLSSYTVFFSGSGAVSLNRSATRA